MPCGNTKQKRMNNRCVKFQILNYGENSCEHFYRRNRWEHEKEQIRKRKRFLLRESGLGTAVEKNALKVEDCFIGMYIELEEKLYFFSHNKLLRVIVCHT